MKGSSQTGPLSSLPLGRRSDRQPIIPDINLMRPTDTIVAIATPPGESALGILRVSGPDALPIISSIFTTSSHSVDLLPRHAHHGWIVHPESRKLIDEVVVVFYPAPRSYTGEDMVEISAHGSMVGLRTIIETVRSLGARLAEPGEFTRRAFLNGKLSLDEAESVIDVIQARSEASLRAATEHLSGKFAQSIEKMRSALTLLLAHVEATLDFPEDEVDAMSASEMQQHLKTLLADLLKSLTTYEHGRVLREGVSVAIVGTPNVGKSSLLNALLRYERALVTPIPGTTRDTIEEPLLIKGIPVKAIDTAGLRVTDDPVESLGMERTRQRISQADIVVLVMDASQPYVSETAESLSADWLQSGKTILCLNKVDLPRRLGSEIGNLGCETVVETSALTGTGIDSLERAICDTLQKGLPQCDEETVLVTRLRHKELLEICAQSVRQAIASLRDRMPLDCVSIDLREAHSALGRITGEDVTEDLLDRIFAEFCIGK